MYTVYVYVLHMHGSARNKDQELVGRFLNIEYFYRLLITVLLRNMANQNGFWLAKCWNWPENGQ